MKSLLGVSAFLVAAFCVFDALGWRTTVGLLCDIMRLSTPWESFTFGLYVVSYLGVWLLTPPLLVAAVLLAATRRTPCKDAGADGMNRA
jgi:hypothetical protein